MNLLYALRRARDFHGDRIAIYDGDRAVTYREFDQRVNRAAHALAAMGVQHGDRVAVWMLNAPQYLELYFATALAGAMIVPLNTRWNLADTVFSLSDSGSRLAVLDEKFALQRDALTAEIPGLRCIDLAEYERALADAPAAPFPAEEPHEHDVAGLFYTSGTTGGPKGVMLTHRNLWANAMLAIVNCGISTDWIYLHAAPMFHLADGASTFATVLQGGAHAFLKAFDAPGFLEAVERYRITSTILVPTMVNAVVNHPELDRFDTSSLRFMLYGASPMPLEILRRAKQKLRCEFIQAYGLSEASPILTVLRPEDHRLEEADRRFAPVHSAGRAVPGVEVRVVDAMDRPLPNGQAGEVVARGANIMKGYWNRPEITADTLRGGWLHTGDIGMLDDAGYLYILDRKKDMIKPGGENVYSPEVESMVASHPDVLEVAVIGVPDEKWGEAIKAVVVLRPGATATEPDIIAYCRARMTHFKCPSSVDVVEALPKGGSGKLQKNILREQFGRGKGLGVGG